MGHINVQVHDSLLVSVDPHVAFDVAHFIKRNLERPLLIYGNQLIPYVEFKLGITWAGDVEYKQLPSREEFTDTAQALDKKRRQHEQA
jgi:hypothetical protein